MKRSLVLLVLGLVLISCGREEQTRPINEMTNSTMAAGRNEWKYRCEATILSGYQWVYQGEASRSEAERGTHFCYGYSVLSNFCTEVRYGGVLGAVIPCNLFNVGRVAYTWNRW